MDDKDKVELSVVDMNKIMEAMEVANSKIIELENNNANQADLIRLYINKSTKSEDIIDNYFKTIQGQADELGRTRRRYEELENSYKIVSLELHNIKNKPKWWKLW